MSEPTHKLAPGLIPAHAGKTVWRTRSGTSCWAHPRSRGENDKRCFRVVHKTGSSPLTRGKPHVVGVLVVHVRLIPAHAGKTHGPPRCLPSRPAHPRSRGENRRPLDLFLFHAGSSPLTRGKLMPKVAPHWAARLIPAHAGKTVSWVETRAVASAHPRSRGENSQAEEKMRPRTGSSPLTRGKHHEGPHDPHQDRLIPAHAGKTWPRPLSSRARPAHPRSRGENDALSGASSAWKGSSPLTRGKR